ncbi:hypothetical protein SODALDRAFT_337444 [Sodiomyces alkalinus F11]|uniref:Uncharacterized protein n=1 Tax=Sodiomyces alkalinus (strain CBS 110278 / VKM F-3762 / F11) TaxID=1314773 RepID=A0A3N2PM11_SODAK|nr:hypothetical protein SODALDRAFT_337444 [Sodiomyces alkalinus F11]ROT35450.1 hypothetical protein SODALDRAFT_337444 [Sodiomyces alkalinus F11]
MAVVEPEPVSPVMDSPMDIDAALDTGANSCNFPEMLARDLECSSLVFAARELTAGAPSRELAYGNSQWRQPQREREHEPASLSPRFSASSVPSHPPDSPTQLPVVRLERARDIAGPSTTTTTTITATTTTTLEASNSDADVASISSGHSFSEIEPASVRQQSVITTATSITGSGRRSAASHKRDTSLSHATNASWIDLEPDADGDLETTTELKTTIPRTEPGSPRIGSRESAAKRPRSTSRDDGRARSPLRASSANAATHQSLPNPFADFSGSGPASRAWSLQVYPRPLSEDQRRRSLHCVEISLGLRPLSRNRPEAPCHHALLHGYPEEQASQLGSPIDEDLKDEIEPWFRYLDEQGGSSEGPKRHSPVKHRPLLSPTSPIDEVQQWLEASIDAAPADEYQNRRIPLPPDVIETLRVSITCFPETMLLCSSLSIETIRSYAKKMKHPADEPVRRTQTPPPSPKKWKWPAVLGQRRSVSSLKREYTTNQRYFSSELTPAAELVPAMAPSVPQPQWSRLRNIFPQGSDYLLDALFAHLVAYSYVSSLLPRQPPPGPSGPSPPRSERCSSDSSFHRPPPRESKDSSSTNDIPRKAWKMLGLEEMETTGGCGGTAPSPRASSVSPQQQQQQQHHHHHHHQEQQQRIVRKKSSFMDSMRSSRLPPPTQGPAEQASMRELQIGLARCVGKLVATLRAGLPEGDELLMLAGEYPKAGEIDPLLVRTLCEIVRCCEAA